MANLMLSLGLVLAIYAHAICCSDEISAEVSQEMNARAKPEEAEMSK